MKISVKTNMSAGKLVVISTHFTKQTWDIKAEIKVGFKWLLILIVLLEYDPVLWQSFFTILTHQQ